nr:hypothetical protein [Brucella anthropi]
MTETKFTPGPWIAAKKHSSKVGLPIVASPHGRSIAAVTFFGLGEQFKSHDEESYANAHLIAAAPELFEKLAKIRGWINVDAEGPWGKRFYAEVDALLAKARGEE